MKAVFFRQHGDVHVLEVGGVPTPTPGPGEVAVAIKACSLNHLDIWIRRGLPSLRVSFPHVSGIDGAGVIAALGEGVTALKIGDPVLVNPVLSCGRCVLCLSGRDNLCAKFSIIGEHRWGCMAERVCVPVGNIVPLGPIQPPHPEVAPHAFIDFASVACLPCNYMTAWQMLVDRAQVKPGDRVLIMGAGSGVGVAALQIALLFSAEVTAAAGTDEKLERSRMLGATWAINYRKQDLVTASRAILKQGYDIIIDHIGTEHMPALIQILRRGGTLVTCGATSGYAANIDLRHVFYRQLSILGSTMAPKARLHSLVELWRQGKIDPVIGTRLPLSEAAKGQRLLEGRAVFGKVVLEL